MKPLSIRLVVFDWAGTTVDFGCFAPVIPFRTAFERMGVEVSMAEARAPMGLSKTDHLRAIASMPAVAARWQARHGRAIGDADLEQIFQEHFLPLQMECLGDHSRLVPGVLECVAWLRERSIKIGTTTGYLEPMAVRVAASARQQGYEPDANCNASQVPAGRPAPWMIHRNMEALGIYPPAAVLKVGDTVPDIDEGRAAGCWSCGVTATSSLVGLDQASFERLSAEQQRSVCDQAANELRAAGAHEVLRSVAEVPRLVERLNQQLSEGRRPA